MGIKNFNDFDKMNEGQDKEESIVEMVGDWIENERADGATESEVRAEIDNYIGALEPNEQQGIRVDEIVKQLKQTRDWTVLEEK